MQRDRSVSSPTSLPSPRPAGGLAPRDWETLVRLVATSFSVLPADLTAPSRRSAQAAFARQVAMYLAHVSFGVTFSIIGRAFGRDRTTAAYGVRVVEDRRDNPHIDALLEQLEHVCAGMAGTTCGTDMSAQ